MTFPLAIIAFDEKYTGNVYKTLSFNCDSIILADYVTFPSSETSVFVSTILDDPIGDSRSRTDSNSNSVNRDDLHSTIRDDPASEFIAIRDFQMRHPRCAFSI